MSSQSGYSRNSNRPRQYYAPQAPMSSTDSTHLYGPARGMGPPYPAQPVEIDLNNPRTLPNPSPSAAVSASNAWDSAIFPPNGIGELSTYGPSSVPRQLHMDTQGRSTAQDALAKWYDSNDGPWIPKVSLEGISSERQSGARVGSRMSNVYETQFRQPIPSDVGLYPYATPPSDSGYGSNGARRSDGNASIFSQDVADRDQDLHSLTGQPAEYQTYHAMGEVLQSRDIRFNDQWPSSLPSSMLPDSPPSLICPTCKKTVKTRSELKKHELRHTKPFTCDFSGCLRTEGFSTTNDLERHMKSKHPSAVQGTNSTKRYRCVVQGCKSKEKSWPRLDNFRSHLKRVHLVKIEQEDEIIRRGEIWEPVVTADLETNSSQPPRSSLPETSSAVEPTIYHTQNSARTTEHNWKQMYPETRGSFQDPLAPKATLLKDQSMSVSPQQKDSSSDEEALETVEPLEIFPSHPQAHKNPSALGHILATPVSRISVIKENRASPPPVSQTSKISLQGKATRHEVSASETAKITEVIKTALVGAQVSGDADDRSPQHSTRNGLPDSRPQSGSSWPSGSNGATTLPIGNSHINLVGSPAVQDDSRDSDAQKKAIEVIKTLHDLGYIIHKDPTHSPKPQNPGSAASSKSENLVTCQKCGKFKGRPCELKKHMKRHSRPYGCTFMTCNKTFGSKNDWKRHENSQHFHLETWRCDEEKPEGGACAKVCYRRQTFQDHLKVAHSISDLDAVKNKVEVCRIGRNCQARFWCGFCTKLIDLTKKGIDAWTERFDHIDHHFMGRHGLSKQGIQDWIPIDSDKPRGDIESPHSLTLSPGKEGDDESSSPSGSTSDGPASAGGSPAHAMNLGSHAGTSNKRKHSGSSDDTSPPKRKAPYRGLTLVYCCQCTAAHNPKIDTACSYCNDSHKFCGSCTYEARPEGAPGDRVPDSRS